MNELINQQINTRTPKKRNVQHSSIIKNGPDQIFPALPPWPFCETLSLLYPVVEPEHHCFPGAHMLKQHTVTADNYTQKPSYWTSDQYLTLI